MRKRFKYPTKLFTLMVLYFIGFSSLLLLISGIVYYGTYSELAYREIRATKEELLDETSQKLTNYVKSIQDTALFLVTNSMVRQHLSVAPDNFFDYVSRNRDFYEEIQQWVTVKEGVISIEIYTDWLQDYEPIQEGFMHRIVDAEEEGWLGRMDQSDGFWLPSHDYLVSGDMIKVVSYVHRIIGVRGQILGIVKINIPDQELFDILNKRNFLSDNYKYYVVMDSQGDYIASVLPEDITVRNHLDEMVEEVSDTKYDLIQSDTNTQSLRLLQLISKEVLQQSGKDIRMLIIGLLAALIILSIPIAFWVSRKLTSPIYAIVEGMSSIEKGDFNVRMNKSNIQEYFYLTTQFNRMVYRLKDLIGRLNQEHRDRREAEIQLLHAQIKPHFLYNTLDLIHWRALDYNAHEISEMVQQLSKLFRIGISNDNWYVTVRDELAHAHCYMAIQGYRQNYSIEYVENIQSDLLDVYIPKIILQPFLENAVIHGYPHRNENAFIKVSIDHLNVARNQELLVTISDNGIGLPDDFDIGTTRGIGIRNVMDRIHLYCGKDYGVKVRSGDLGGTEVIINLPLIHREEEMKKLTRSFSDEYDSFGR